MKQNVLLRRPWLTAGLVVASLVLISTLTFAALNLRHVHASGTGGGGGGGGGLGCAPANGTPTCHFKGVNAYAEYVIYGDSTSCVGSQASIFVFDDVQHDQPNSPTGGPSIYVSLFKYDTCNYNILLDAEGTTTQVDFKHDDSLSSASASAMVPVYDSLTGNTLSVAVNLTWKGMSVVQQVMDSYQIRTANTTYRTHFKADNRLAIVSGTISDGTTNYVSGPTMASLYSAQGGSFEIIRQ